MATPGLVDDGLKLRLREARRGVGLTQKEVADELGVTRRAVSEWETGHRRPHSKLPELAVLYGVSTAYLLTGAEEASVELRELRAEVATLTLNMDSLFEQVIAQGTATAVAIASVLELLGLDPAPADDVDALVQQQSERSAPPARRDAPSERERTPRGHPAGPARPERE